MPEMVTIGETLVAFCPVQNGPLRYVPEFRKSIAGAESNVAIGLCRLGHSCGWISRVGRDEFGKYLIREIRAEGVDISGVETDEELPTGIMFKEIIEGKGTKVYYYRKNSAASRMIPENLDADYIRSAKILHITGITPALSPSCLDTVKKAACIARENGVTVSFDLNIRLKLWDRKRATRVIKSILPGVDIVLTGKEEAEIIFGIDDEEEIFSSFFAFGIKTIALKMGKMGCRVAGSNQKHIVQPFKVSRVIDTIGAGDAFDAGFLAGVLEKKTLLECGILGNAMGAFAVTTTGDIDGLPDRDELTLFINRQKEVCR